MPVTIEGQTYYRTAEVYGMLGVSRNTLYRFDSIKAFSERLNSGIAEGGDYLLEMK